MTMIEQITLANEKVAHWQHKQGHAQAMLAKWQERRSVLQAKGKPQPTSAKLPKLVLVPGTEHLMPRSAITTKSDQAAAEHLARETALRDMAKDAGSDSIKSKAKASNGWASMSTPREPKLTD